MHNWPNQAMQRTASRHESQVQVPETQSIFHPRAQRNAFRRRDARQQSRSVARENQWLIRNPKTQPGFLEIVSDDFPVFHWPPRLIIKEW
jgi:hypothetical protein